MSSRMQATRASLRCPAWRLRIQHRRTGLRRTASRAIVFPGDLPQVVDQRARRVPGVLRRCRARRPADGCREGEVFAAGSQVVTMLAANVRFAVT